MGAPRTRLCVGLLLTLVLLQLPQHVSGDLSSNRSRRLSTSRSKTQARRPERQLVEDDTLGLECDLQLYHDFINSDEGADIFIMATMCESRIKYIKDLRAGKYGPVEQDDLRSVMCSNECLKSDTLHNLAMAKSRCSCAQVSANTCITHDFCLENSARLLCTHLGECGHWNCELEDFMCLRNEWDRYYACSALSLRLSLLGFSIVVVTLVALL